ncbi:MAG: hypothetical protein ABUL64_02370 [Singulisphaera sp.]
MSNSRAESRLAVCSVSHQEKFEDCAVLVDAIQELLAAVGLAIRGEVAYRGERKYLKPLPAEGLPALIPENDLCMVTLGFNRGELQIMRKPIFGDEWGENVQVRAWLFDREPLEYGILFLKAMVSVLGSFWGEVNDIAITKYPTFCGVNEHYCRVPGMGLANYFGAEYVHYFGGVHRFKNAPHLQVQEFGAGLITTFPCSSFDEFSAQRADVRRHLGDLLFEPAPAQDGGVDPIKGRIDRQLFWPGKEFDDTENDRVMEQILELEERRMTKDRSGIQKQKDDSTP